MKAVQQLFMTISEILLQTRYSKKGTPFRTFGLQTTCERNHGNREVIQNNWREDQQNELILQFFIEKDGVSYLVEEWSLLQTMDKKNRRGVPIKQMSILMHSAIVMMTMTSLHQENKFKVNHSFLFYNKVTKKRSDWVDDSQVEVKKLTVKMSNHFCIHLTVAQQGNLSNALAQKMSEEPIQRQRFNSEQFFEQRLSLRGLKQRKMTFDSHSSSSTNLLNRSIISVYDRKEDVEFLSTPEEANRYLEGSFSEDNFEIQLVVTDEPDSNAILSAFLSSVRLSKEDKDQKRNTIQNLRDIKSQHIAIREDSYQVAIVLNQLFQ